MSGKTGLALVLHGHLPFVRRPDLPRFHEETWLFEAVIECYLPLIEAMAGWERDGLPWRLSLNLSPTLLAMLDDELLRFRCRDHLERLARLAEAEIGRTRFTPPMQALALFYAGRLQARLAQYDQLRGNVAGAFARFQDAGRLEILACPGAHPLLPLLLSDPDSVRAQMDLGARLYRRRFGRRPAGWWLPECGWTPELDPVLASEGVRWFVVETHGMLNATPRPRRGLFAPVMTPGGAAAYGRDATSAWQVWSRHGGYPGDPRYREFHHDLIHESDPAWVAETLPLAPGGFTGIKYRRITGASTPGPEKALYDRSEAMAAVEAHAAHFVGQRALQGAEFRRREPGAEPLVTAPFDAELFGHWWFEGPEFLDAVVRRAASPDSGVELTTPGEHLVRCRSIQESTPAASTWGEAGGFQTWANEANAWIQPALRTAAQAFRRARLACTGGARSADAVAAGRQAGRELLLAQASDWPFLISTRGAGDYPAVRVRAHVEACEELCALAQSLASGRAAAPADLERLRRLASIHNFEAGITDRLWPELAGDCAPAVR